MRLSALDVRRKSCEAKVAYNSVAVARTFADIFTAQRGVKVFVYRCRYCPKFHLTRQEVGSVA